MNGTHHKPRSKDVLGERAYSRMANYYTTPPVRTGTPATALAFLHTENFDNLSSSVKDEQENVPAYGLSSEGVSPILDLSRGTPSSFLCDENQTMKPLSKTVNHFDSPKDKKAAALALREATGGVSPSIRLSSHVETINEHLKIIGGSQFEIGKELIAIMQERDFAEDTIEEFVKNTWGWTRQRAYELADAYRVQAGLPENVINLLQNTGQAKALKAAPESKRAEVLSEVAASGSVTAKKISEKIAEKEKAVDGEFEEVKKPAEEILDDNGILVPEHLHAAWRDERATEQDLRMHALVLLERWPAKMYGELSENQKKVLKSLLGALAIAVCPACKGEKCKECHKRGIVSKRPLLGTVK